jgi:predicted O-methyltransferase YrrM
VYGDARQMIENLDGEFDLIFIDADKASYAHYFDKLLPKLSQHGVMLLDNVLWSGKVTQPIAPSDIETRTLVELNKRISDDNRLDKVLLPLRDGMMMLRKK